jgi:hypothetical protein
MRRLEDTPSQPRLKAQMPYSRLALLLSFQNIHSGCCTTPCARDFWIEIIQLEIDHRSSSVSRKTFATVVG